MYLCTLLTVEFNLDIGLDLNAANESTGSDLVKAELELIRVRLRLFMAVFAAVLSAPSE